MPKDMTSETAMGPHYGHKIDKQYEAYIRMLENADYEPEPEYYED
jgi:hypothetical protein